MMLSKSRFEELKKLWQRKKTSRKGAKGTHVSIFQIPRGMNDLASVYRRGGRPKKLRGDDFLQELARLALEWGDQRIAKCARALLELGIVIVDKQKHRFSEKRGPHLGSPEQDAQEAIVLKQQVDAHAVNKVQALMKRHRSLSVREASAEIAAALGLEAASFEAAAQRVRNAFKARMGKQTRG
jgi:hypothetical protein